MAMPAPADVARLERRRTGLEERFTLAMAVGLLTLFYCLLSVIYFATTGPSQPTAIVSLCLAIMSVPVGRAAFRSGGMARLALAIVLLMAQFAILWSALPPGVHSLHRLLGISMYLVAGSTFAVILLAGIHLLSPAKALLLSFSISMTWIAGEGLSEAWSRWRLSTVAAVQAASVEPDSLGPLLAQTTLIWAGSPAQNHPVLGWTCRPHSWLKTILPSNPLGYLDREAVYGPLDMRLWAVLADASHADLAPCQSASDRRRLAIKKAGAFPKDVVIAYAPVPILAGVRYTLSFRARGEAARPLAIAVTANHDLKGIVNANEADNAGLRESIDLTSDFRSYSFSFRASRSDASAAIYLIAGGNATTIEWSDVDFRPSRDVTNGQLDMRAWKSVVNPGCEAVLTPAETPEGVVRYSVRKVSGGPAWHVHLLQDTFPVHAGESFCLFFRARSAKPKRLQFLVSQSSPPFGGLGPVREITLGPSWRTYGDLYQSPVDEPNARVVLNAGGDTGDFELADVQFVRMKNESIDPPARYRYCISYGINSLGFRDTEHAEVAAPNTFRIACLGDSFTFAQGVRAKDSYVERLGDLLNAAGAQSRQHFEMLNFGICGYDTRQERLSYELFARRFKPKLVLVGMVNNDNMSSRDENEFLEMQRARDEKRLFKNLAGLDALISRATDFSVCVKELKELSAACQRDGAKLAVFFFHVGDDERWQSMIPTVTAGLRGTGIPVLDLGPTFLGFHYQSLIVHDMDKHPNHIAHRIAAEELEQFLIREKLLPGL